MHNARKILPERIARIALARIASLLYDGDIPFAELSRILGLEMCKVHEFIRRARKENWIGQAREEQYRAQQEQYIQIISKELNNHLQGSLDGAMHNEEVTQENVTLTLMGPIPNCEKPFLYPMN